jgi:hypothetical protein
MIQPSFMLVWYPLWRFEVRSLYPINLDSSFWVLGNPLIGYICLSTTFVFIHSFRLALMTWVWGLSACQSVILLFLDWFCSFLTNGVHLNWLNGTRNIDVCIVNYGLVHFSWCVYLFDCLLLTIFSCLNQIYPSSVELEVLLAGTSWFALYALGDTQILSFTIWRAPLLLLLRTILIQSTFQGSFAIASLKPVWKLCRGCRKLFCWRHHLLHTF